MRYISWVFGIALFLLALGFAIKNSEIVTLHYYLGYQWQAPLVAIVLGAFCAGAGAGIAASLGFIFKQRHEISRLRRELHNLHPPLEAQASGSGTPTLRADNPRNLS
jgi:uncharacterized integral membrane protein